MKKSALLSGIFCYMLFLAPQIHAHGPHEHGAAKMDVAVDGNTVTIEFETPLANMLSFEHAPSTPAQVKQVEDMSRKMRRAETLFRLTPAAECRLDTVALASEKLDAALLGQDAAAGKTGGDKEQGGKAEQAEQEEHGDLDATFTFACARPEKLNSIDVRMFTVWPGLKKLETQLSAPKGQRAANLTPAKHLLSW